MPERSNIDQRAFKGMGAVERMAALADAVAAMHDPRAKRPTCKRSYGRAREQLPQLDRVQRHWGGNRRLVGRTVMFWRQRKMRRTF